MTSRVSACVDELNRCQPEDLENRWEINWLSLMELAFSSLFPFGPHYSPLSFLAPPPPTPFPLLPQSSIALSEHHRPLLAAAVKGFLTRRLLRTQRVMQLVRTIRVSGDSSACVKQHFYLQELFVRRLEL